MRPNKLNIAIRVDSQNVAFWIYSLIGEINKCSQFEIVLVITKDNF
jgi:hypothetical protein